MEDPKTLIRDLGRFDGQDVTLNGWLYGKRGGGKIVFLQVRDGTGICQCVVEAAAPEAFAAATGIPQEASLALTGTVRRDERSVGGYEIAVKTLEVIQGSEGYPITRKAHGIDFLMQHRHLWLRSRRPTAILRIRHTFIQACRDYFDRNGFTLIDTPILVPGAGEDTQTLFPVQYFDREAYLAQTGQLYLETACMALGKVYCFGPTFRAEKSKTRRHLTEFWMLEPEIPFAQLDDVMALGEGLVCYAVAEVLRRNEEDLKFLGRDLDVLRRILPPFHRVTYTEAVEILHSDETRTKMEAGIERDRATLQQHIDELKKLDEQIAATKKETQRDALSVRAAELREVIQDLETDLANRPEHIRLAQSFEWGGDLGGSDETIISRHFDKPVFVTDYPRQAKAFYMKRLARDSRTVRNVDLLAPDGYGEIIGGSQREDNLDMLVEAMKDKGLKPEDYDWYLDLRRYGSMPHGGFGLGVERCVTWICGLKHVRETIPFPRTMGRMQP
jgi:asparaginyl-tRNA synthetase